MSHKERVSYQLRVTAIFRASLAEYRITFRGAGEDGEDEDDEDDEFGGGGMMMGGGGVNSGMGHDVGGNVGISVVHRSDGPVRARAVAIDARAAAAATLDPIELFTQKVKPFHV